MAAVLVSVRCHFAGRTQSSPQSTYRHAADRGQFALRSGETVYGFTKTIRHGPMNPMVPNCRDHVVLGGHAVSRQLGSGTQLIFDFDFIFHSKPSAAVVLPTSAFFIIAHIPAIGYESCGQNHTSSSFKRAKRPYGLDRIKPGLLAALYRQNTLQLPAPNIVDNDRA